MRPYVVYEDDRYLVVSIAHLQLPAITAQTVSSPILRQ